MIRTALIGFGLAGRAFHAPLIAATPALHLSAIVTSRAQEVERLYPYARVVADPASVFADDAIDLVVVATPNESHAPLARQALLAGKHVVVDKPFTLDPDEGAALIALATERDRVLSVFHNRRWDNDFLTVASLLAAGTLGEVMLAELRWDRFRPAVKQGWRETEVPGAGLLADLGPHLIDQALHLFGPFETLSADVGRQRADAVADDYFELTLTRGALRVIVSAATLVAAPRPRFALHGTGGSFVKHGIDPQEAVLRAGGSPADPGYGVEDASLHGVRTDADGKEHRVPSLAGDWTRFYAGMARAIAERAAPPIDPADALAGLRLLSLARQSAQSGTRIELPPLT